MKLGRRTLPRQVAGANRHGGASSSLPSPAPGRPGGRATASPARTSARSSWTPRCASAAAAARPPAPRPTSCPTRPPTTTAFAARARPPARTASRWSTGPRRPDGDAAVREAPVHALRGAGLRLGLPGAGARQAAHRPGGLRRRASAWAAATAWWPARSTVPKYEYAKALPVVRKCTFCAGRQAEGKLPACIGVCPSGALTYGTRGELVEEARRRVYGNPDKYTQHIYGEHEAGGTNWMYITDVSFEKLGVRGRRQRQLLPEAGEGRAGRAAGGHDALAAAPDGALGLLAPRRQGQTARTTAAATEDTMASLATAPGRTAPGCRSASSSA